jgi:His-Xaa-Ser system radical SAM maturase HxsC
MDYMIKLRSNNNLIHSDSKTPKILKITTNPNLPKILREKKALIIDNPELLDVSDYGMVFSTQKSENTEVEFLDTQLSYLDDGDVIRVVPNSNTVRAIYRVNASANFLFVTERCNSFCIMCSQPPRDVADGHLIEELIEAVPLIDKGAAEIGITGGEPTLLGDRFIKLLHTIKICHPGTAIHVLTNGRTFSDPSLVEKVSELKHSDLMFGIPLYSDISNHHDFVVQADSAFDETIKGILNLKRHSQKVEIRVVIHKQTYSRLPQLAEFIGRNLQFVDHVALMGLEITGFTRANLEELWIDPVEYISELERAVEILTRYKIRTSIYNLQRCLIPKRLWPYAVKSISDWKNKYYEECHDCSQKHNCGGFFASADIRKSDFIKAL